MTTLSPPASVRRPTAVALGTFDGLHAGHRLVLSQARAMAADDPTPEGGPIPTLVSFWPHPREVLDGEPRLRLDLPEEKLVLLDSLGIDQLVLLPFTTQLARLTPEAFVREILVGQLGARCVAVGENFRFGVNRSGGVEDLCSLGRRHGMRVAVVPLLRDADGRVSSSRIREALAEGKIAEAEALLGRPYRFEGCVRKGRGLGRQMGWPTANLEVGCRKFLPREGVYAALVWTPALSGGIPKPAVMNLGRQPTVDAQAASAVEVHLLDYDQDLLGQLVVVQPIRWLRGQCRFANLEQLSNQISADAYLAKTLLTGLQMGA